jgi:Protein of unknown function (DUF3105)
VTSKKPQNRRDAAAQMRAQQGADRARGWVVVGASALVGVLIIGSALWFGSGVPYVSKSWYADQKFADLSLADLGAPASACGEITTKPADGNQDHVEPGTPVTYPDAPPAFGTHYNVWESMDRKLYTAADRPDLGKLVHNLEHGFTILWYDETVADDPAMMDDLRAISTKYEGTDDLRLKFKAAPWLASDGEAFPDGQHVAFTHWSNGGTGSEATGKQVGVWQYCSAPSGPALQDFMTKYPYVDSPEPNAV